LLGLAHDGRERRRAIINIEQVVERAGENAFNARDLIAGLAQVTQRLDYWQPGTDRGLVQVIGAALPARNLEALVVGQRAAVGLLVRRHDAPRARGLAVLFQPLAPGRQIQPEVGEPHLPRTQDAAYPQIDLELARQPLLLAGELVQQHPAHGPRADHADRQRMRRQVEAGMRRAQRTRRVAAVDHHRYVALRSALRYRSHVDV